eukprot:jgi/Bigna1/71351/fgenesh1_pg.15_\
MERSEKNSTGGQNGSKKHAMFCVLAEFDLLEGSVVRYQHPKVPSQGRIATFPSENAHESHSNRQVVGIISPIQLLQRMPPSFASDSFLAEAMLPEGSHSRLRDKTVFMLPQHQHSTDGNDFKQKGDSIADKADTKDEQRFQPVPCIWIYLKTRSIARVAIQNAEPRSDSQPFVLWIVPHSCLLAKKDDKVKRGSVTKAVAVCSPHTFIHALEPVINLALEELLQQSSPEMDRDIIKELYERINAMVIPSRYTGLSGVQKALIRASRLRPAHMRPMPDLKLQIRWRSEDVVTTVPPVVGEDEIGKARLLVLLQRFDKDFMTIFNAMLLERRVLFIGHNLPASDVVEHVLAACLLISPPLSGVKRRVFPYTSLTNLDTLLNTKGYVAGVTNPIFAQREAWWDVCCDLNTGKVTMAASYKEDLKADPAEAARRRSSTTTTAPSSSKPVKADTTIEAPTTIATTKAGGRTARSSSGVGSKEGGGKHSNSLRGSSSRSVSRNSSRDQRSSSSTVVYKPSRQSAAAAAAAAAATAPDGAAAAADIPAERFHDIKKYDNEFAGEVRVGLTMGRGEVWVREMMTAYTQRVVDMAFGDSSAGEATLSANHVRIRMLKDTTQFRRHAEQRASRKFSGPCGEESGKVARFVRRLQHEARSLKKDGFVEILDYFLSTLDNNEKLIQLLTLLPESQGGLYPIAICLLHSSRQVQEKALQLLRRFDAFREGALWLSSLNFFLMRTYMRSKIQYDAEHKGETGGAGSTEIKQKEQLQRKSDHNTIWIPAGEGVPPAPVQATRRTSVLLKETPEATNDYVADIIEKAQVKRKQ